MSTLFAAIVVLGILIFVHELGHFLVAKRVGVDVLKFSLGFGPKVLGWRGKTTHYVISAIPLGGFVKMLGEEDGAEVAPADFARSFAGQSVGARAAIVVAGAGFNLLCAFFAFVVSFAIFGAGQLSDRPQVGRVIEGKPAQAAGLQEGDLVVAIDGKPIATWQELSEAVRASGGKRLELAVERARTGEKETVYVLPEMVPDRNMYGEELGKTWVIGIGRPVEVEPVGLLSAVGLGAYQTYFWVKMTVVTLGKLIAGSVSARDLGGPVLIVKAAGQQAERGIDYLIRFLAIVSVNLAVLNLLPIPILDGGHLLFLALEKARGRPLKLRHRELAQTVGLVILVALMIFVTFNDVARLVQG